jgi:hypothetical protein
MRHIRALAKVALTGLFFTTFFVAQGSEQAAGDEKRVAGGGDANWPQVLRGPRPPGAGSGDGERPVFDLRVHFMHFALL